MGQNMIKKNRDTIEREVLCRGDKDGDSHNPVRLSSYPVIRLRPPGNDELAAEL